MTVSKAWRNISKLRAANVYDFMTGAEQNDAVARTLGSDLTAAVQAAMSSLSAGGMLIVPRGAYLISDTLVAVNGTTIRGDNSGDTATSTMFQFTGAAKPCIKVGTSDSAFNYGNAIRDLYIYLTQQNGDGIKLNATVEAELKNIVVQGTIANLGTRTCRGFDIDGRNVSSFFNSMMNCRATHCHEGFVVRTTGTTSPTQQNFYNCYAGCDYAAGDITGNGFNFANAGESSVLIGGDMEDCARGLYIQGGATGPAFTWIGPRFENNLADIQINSTRGGLVIIGSSTLDPAKVNDNSGAGAGYTNTIQYGVAGTVAGSGLVVTAGQTIINGASHRISSFVGTATGITGSPTGTVKYTLSDNVVTLDFPVFSGASSSTAFTITGMPAEICPVGGSKVVIVRVVDNSAAAHAAIASIDTAGVITLSNTLDAGGLFTAANTKELQSCSVSYTKA